MGIKEGEKGQAKVTFNIINKIITENFPDLIQVQETSRTPNSMTKTEPLCAYYH
jgi:hypothetical protein